SRDAGEFIFLLAPDAELEQRVGSALLRESAAVRSALDEPWLPAAQGGLLADAAGEYRELLRAWCDTLQRPAAARPAPETLARRGRSTPANRVTARRWSWRIHALAGAIAPSLVASSLDTPGSRGRGFRTRSFWRRSTGCRTATWSFFAVRASSRSPCRKSSAVP